MRISAVEAHRCALPLVRPFRTSFGTERTRDVIILEVTMQDGTVGWGECVAARDPLYSHEFNDAALLVWQHFLVPRVLGRDLAAEEVPALLAPVRGHPMARGALEMAILDAHLRAGWSVAGRVLRVVARRDPVRGLRRHPGRRLARHAPGRGGRLRRRRATSA